MIFNNQIWPGMNCWPKIICGSPTINRLQVSYYQDFMASTHSIFFQGHMERGLFYWPTHSGELCCPSNNNNNKTSSSFSASVCLFKSKTIKMTS